MGPPLGITGAAALALLAAPAFAQEATTADPATTDPAAAAGTEQMAAGDPQQMRDAAIQSAEGVGITGVSDVAGAPTCSRGPRPRARRS